MVKNGLVKIVNPGWCKACEICVEICPTDVLEVRDGKITVARPEKCIACENCELICPDYVLKVVKDDG